MPSINAMHSPNDPYCAFPPVHHRAWRAQVATAVAPRAARSVAVPSYATTYCRSSGVHGVNDTWCDDSVGSGGVSQAAAAAAPGPAEQ